MAAGSPKPFSTMSQPSAASAVAMASPIPLVEPVTIAVLPFNIDGSLKWCALVSIGARRRNPPAAGGDIVFGRRARQASAAAQRGCDMAIERMLTEELPARVL